MPIHVDFSAAASGAAWQTVHCEKCNKPYHYALVRKAEATVRAAYGFGQGAAENRADKTAQAKLMKLLERGVEIVPCPTCGWVQNDMVREARRRTARWLLYVAIVCFGAGLCFAIFPLGELMFVADPELTPAEKSRATAGFLIGTGAAIAALIVRRMIQSTINPNANYPKRPEPVPGMPSGIPGKAPVLPRGATSYVS